MKKFASIVSVTDNYQIYLTTQLNSFAFYGHTHDVHIIALDLKPEYLEWLRDRNWPFELYIHEKTLDDFPELLPQGKMMVAKKSRYAMLASGLLDDYDAVLLLDADLFAVNNFNKYFQMVADSPVIIGANERFKWNLRRYKFNGTQLPDVKMFWMICNAPLFFSPKVNATFVHKAYKSGLHLTEPERDEKHIPSDLFTMNVAIWLAKVQENVVLLPSYAWTGVHASYTDIITRITRQDDKWFSWSGEPVYMIHGRWDRATTSAGYMRWQAKRFVELQLNEAVTKKYSNQAQSTLKAIEKQFAEFSAMDFERILLTNRV